MVELWMNMNYAVVMPIKYIGNKNMTLHIILEDS